MVATLTLIATTIILPAHSNTAMADDGDQLYCIAGGGTKLRPYTGTGKVTDINTATVGVSNVTISYAKIDGAWQPINPATCTVSNSPEVSIPSSSQWRGKDLDSINSHTAIGYGGSKGDSHNAIGVDNDGRLWFEDWNSNNTKSWSHTADTYRFSHITSVIYDLDTKFNKNFDGTLLLGHRISDTAQATQVMQMPTTGAPEGLTTFGLTAVGLGLAGLAFALVRRRS